VLESNFADLGEAQKIREFTKNAVEITIIDRKPYLLFVPNIPYEVFENQNPIFSMHMPVAKVLTEKGIRFV